MSSFFDTIVDIYDDTRALPKETMNEVIEAMVDELKDTGKVLDLGIGTGRFAEPMEEHGINVVGIDISRAMLKKAQLKGLGSLIIGDVCALPFKDSSFDSIICVHVLHLIEDCDRVLREIKRVGIGRLVSVLYSKSGFHVIKEYEEAISACGFSLELPGILESGVKERVPPKREVPIKPFKEMLTIRERLKLLKERKHSYTLNTPSQAHECAIKYLRNKYDNKLDAHTISEIEVVVWDIADLPDSFST